MNNKSYINFNGSLKPVEQPVLPVDNRAFRYGDALFETIRYHKGTPLFFEDHYKRLLGGMDILMMETGSLPTPDKLSKQITSLVVKNAIFKDARIRLTVFRNGAGLYTPETNSVSYLIEASPLDNGFYTYNKKGLLIGVFDKYHKPVLPYSGFKNANSLLNILGSIYKKENNFDDCLILNEKGKIIEALSSNLFWIKNNTVFTPSTASGCVDGIMRKQVIKTITKSGMEIKETQGTAPEELFHADEVFITNSIQGIQRVVGIGDKRYYSFKTKKIFTLLTENIRQMLEEDETGS